MPWYYLTLAGAAIVVVLLSHKTPRALLWIAGLAASFMVSVAYLRFYAAAEATNSLGVYFAAGGFIPLEAKYLPPSLIAAACDAVLCVAIAIWGREVWETRWLYSLGLAMMAVNLLYSSGLILGFPPIPDQETLGIVLEAINYAALLLIGGTGILDLVRDGNGSIRGALGRVLGAGRSYLHTPAQRSLWRK